MRERYKVVSEIFPTTELFVVIVTVIISLVLPWQFAYLFVLPLNLILALLNNKFKPYFKRLWIVLLFILLIMFLFQLLLDKSTEHVYLNLGSMRVTLNGILNGLEQTKFILTLTTLFLLFFETTDIEDLVISFQEKNVNHVTSRVIMTTMTIVPEMTKKSSRIIKAQEARGVEVTGSLKSRAKVSFPSLGPLIISSLSEVDEKTITLEARKFASENEKACLKRIKKTTTDGIIFYVFIALVVLALVWRFK